MCEKIGKNNKNKYNTYAKIEIITKANLHAHACVRVRTSSAWPSTDGTRVESSISFSATPPAANVRRSMLRLCVVRGERE